MLATRNMASNKIEFYSFKYLADKVRPNEMEPTFFPFLEHNTYKTLWYVFWSVWLIKLKVQKNLPETKQEENKTFYSQINFGTSKKREKEKNAGNNER